MPFSHGWEAICNIIIRLLLMAKHLPAPCSRAFKSVCRGCLCRAGLLGTMGLAYLPALDHPTLVRPGAASGALSSSRPGTSRGGFRRAGQQVSGKGGRATMGRCLPQLTSTPCSSGP